MFFGWLSLVGLSALAFLASLSLSVRARFESRSELGVAIFALWQGIIILPILGLGWAHRLDAPTLGLAVLVLSLFGIGASLPPRGVRPHVQAVSKALLGLVRLPLDALWSARESFVVVGLVACLASLVWTAWLAYLAPSAGWDGIWYHDMIVGYAIQNRGFQIVAVPPWLEHVNGFPRVCEALNLWFVIFTDRRLIELPNSLMGVPLMLASYAITRRYTNHVAAMGWASALVLMPGVVLQLATTYIDLHVAALFLGAVAFCTKPFLRLRDAWIAALYLALLAGSKGLALAWVPLVGLVGLGRVVARNGKYRPWAAVGTVGGGIFLVLVIAGPFYLRNWLVFHNAIWPIALMRPQFHINWPGVHDVIEMNKPPKEVILSMLSVPVPGSDWPDTRVYGYGLGIPWLVLPAAAVALPIAIFKYAGSLLGFIARDRSLDNLLMVAIPMLLTIPTSPALWAARYNIHLPAAFIFLVAWLLKRRPFLHEAFTSITIMTSLMMLWWADPGWLTRVPDALRLMHQSPRERAAFHAAAYLIATPTALARDAELGRGDLAVFADTCAFPALLWNERFTNRIIHFPSGPDPEEFVDRVERSGAKWVAVGQGSPQWSVLSGRTEKWQVVGDASTTGPPTIAFRRVQ